VTALKGTEKDAKINACVELAAAKEKAAPAVPALMGCLTDRDPEVRRLAAYALGEIGPPAAKALPALKQLLGDEDRAVMMQAANSCRAIDPKSIPKGLVTQKTATP
jgi:HEAT repeat protein